MKRPRFLFGFFRASPSGPACELLKIRLHAHQRIDCDCKSLFEPDRHVCRKGCVTIEEVAERLAGHMECEFRFNPAGDSDLIPATIPI
jgi:hypothetical protein